MSSTSVITLGDFSESISLSGSKKIIRETDKTLSFFIIKVSDKDTKIVINIDSNNAKFVISSLSDLYDDGMTARIRDFPWLLTYDTSNDIYVLVYEPSVPIMLNRFEVVVQPPSGSSITYSYECVFLKENPKT